VIQTSTSAILCNHRRAIRCRMAALLHSVVPQVLAIVIFDNVSANVRGMPPVQTNES
jgi:hypothetical protein